MQPIASRTAIDVCGSRHRHESKLKAVLETRPWSIITMYDRAVFSHRVQLTDYVSSYGASTLSAACTRDSGTLFFLRGIFFNTL